MLKFIRAGKTPDTIAATFDTLIIAGWTGRDSAALQHHIEELAALGIPRPSSVPVFYRASASLLTQTDRLEVLGPDTSGEVEPVLLGLKGGMYLGVGSDHTDRRAETMGIALAKQLCGKVIGTELWPVSEVAEHWDRLVIRSYARSTAREPSIRKVRSPDCERLTTCCRAMTAASPCARARSCSAARLERSEVYARPRALKWSWRIPSEAAHWRMRMTLRRCR